MQKALITGGSSGIGLELAKIMADNGHDLVLAARDRQQLKKVKADIEQDYGVSVDTVTIDLSKAGSGKKLHNRLKEQGVEILVNNAGVGLVGDFLDEDIARNGDIDDQPDQYLLILRKRMALHNLELSA